MLTWATFALAVISANVFVASEHAAPYTAKMLGGWAKSLTKELNDTLGSHYTSNSKENWDFLYERSSWTNPEINIHHPVNFMHIKGVKWQLKPSNHLYLIVVYCSVNIGLTDKNTSGGSNTTRLILFNSHNDKYRLWLILNALTL